MTRAVLDPNVLVSALISPKGIRARLVDAAENGLNELVVSAHLLGETQDVLLRPRFRRHFPEEAARLHVARLRGFAAAGEEGEVVSTTPDPKDDYLVALAVASAASYLVSGHPHLLGLATGSTGGISTPVLTPREFLEQLELGG